MYICKYTYIYIHVALYIVSFHHCSVPINSSAVDAKCIYIYIHICIFINIYLYTCSIIYSFISPLFCTH